ncbi:bifunctional oligoribonuclease/PAP phosphatase NrnA [Candidatus Parcubacteria bacterium]|jgi:phosphoesterase RecJ-like protein|nr:MAG: bifunctional oligoribonuclease/PAP phosphatase NrnA [Candidatus Parcubacteria bacterium]
MTENPQIFKQIHQAIEKANEILLIAHQKPDGDTLGANLAMANWLKSLGKHFHIFCLHPVPQHLRYLPLWEHVQYTDTEISRIPFEAVIFIDSSNVAYAGAGAILEKLKNHATIINIDHHASNPGFGDLNYVDPDASSASEMIYRFFNYHQIQINRDIATCLLTGILTDTGGFSNLATTQSSMKIAGKLLGYGAKFRTITNHTVKNKTVNTLKLWGRALDRLTRHADGIVSTVITQADLQEYEVTDEDLEGIANFLNALQDARIIMVLKEDPTGFVKVSLRTTQDGVDVTELANKFGGGGHQKAAGFSLPGKLIRTPTGWRIEAV